MRRACFLLTVVLLVFVVAATATAAPDLGKNKFVSTWEIDCTTSNVPDLGEFTVHAKGLPGWPTDPWSATPIHFRAASRIEVWEGGVKIFEHDLVPPTGLEASRKMVGPCFMHVYGGDPAVFDVLVYDAYYFFPTPAE